MNAEKDDGKRAPDRGKPDPRDLILEAARDVFSSKGKEGARMQEIADQAGVNKAMLHYYFRSKDNLFSEMFFAVFTDFVEGLINSMGDQKDIQGVIQMLVNHYIDFISAHPEMPPLMLRELASGGGELLNVMPKIFSTGDLNLASTLFEFIQEGISSGKMRPVDPLQTIISILSMAIFFFGLRPVLRRVWGGVVDDERFVEERKQAILDLLHHGIFISS